MNGNSKSAPKGKKLRHNEYYGIQPVLDNLYQKATKGNSFKNLMSIIISDENILLAYRNIKGNKGSRTAACDNVNIKNIEGMEQSYFLNEVKRRFQNYQPQKVRRKEISKPNGQTRPLGIPAMWDRIIQQCILQVMEPICEAHFSNRSYGFRPNRSAEHALADASVRVNKQNLTYVVDVDIKGFFDEVNHVKLMRQFGFIVAPLYMHEGWEEGYRELFERLYNALKDLSIPNLTFELIQHRFTKPAKKVIQERYPSTKLEMDEEKRKYKWGTVRHREIRIQKR